MLLPHGAMTAAPQVLDDAADEWLGGLIDARPERCNLVHLDSSGPCRSFHRTHLSHLVSHPGGDSRDEHVRVDATTANAGRGSPLALLEKGPNEIARLDRRSSGAACVMPRQLEHQPGYRLDARPGGWRHAQLATGERGQYLQVLFETLQDLVRIQLKIAHHL